VVVPYSISSRFEASAGLCIPHIVQAAKRNPSYPCLGSLVEAQRGKYARLVAELGEFCRKHDYRCSRETWGVESDAWLRASEILVGKRGSSVMTSRDNVQNADLGPSDLC
jgi:hypothetical protein